MGGAAYLGVVLATATGEFSVIVLAVSEYLRTNVTGTGVNRHGPIETVRFPVFLCVILFRPPQHLQMTTLKSVVSEQMRQPGQYCICPMSSEETAFKSSNFSLCSNVSKLSKVNGLAHNRHAIVPLSLLLTAAAFIVVQ
jgi:hypothetical protein